MRLRNVAGMLKLGGSRARARERAGGRAGARARARVRTREHTHIVCTHPRAGPCWPGVPGADAVDLSSIMLARWVRLQLLRKEDAGREGWEGRGAGCSEGWVGAGSGSDRGTERDEEREREYVACRYALASIEDELAAWSLLAQVARSLSLSLSLSRSLSLSLSLFLSLAFSLSLSLSLFLSLSLSLSLPRSLAPSLPRPLTHSLARTRCLSCTRSHYPRRCMRAF